MNEKLSNETSECIILNLRLISISLNSHNARKSVSLHSQSRFAAICVRKSCTRPLYLAQLKDENCSFAKHLRPSIFS